jgi:polygalacturonase
MDIDCCKNVRVTNCFVNAPWDDGICPKSSFALGYNRPTRNVAIANCYVSGCWQLGTLLDGTYKRQSTGGGRIKCGTESNGGFINIAISNCVFEGTQGLALETVDGALLEDITVSNITMRDITSCPIFLRLGARLRGPKGTGDQSTVVGTLRRVLISNLNCFNTGARFGSILSGIPGYFIEDVKLDNIYVQTAGGGAPESVNARPAEDETKYPEPGMFGVTPAHGFYLRHIKLLELSRIEVQLAAPDRAHLSTSTTFTARTSSPSPPPTTPPAFSVNNSTDVRILISRAPPDSITP